MLDFLSILLGFSLGMILSGIIWSRGIIWGVRRKEEELQAYIEDVKKIKQEWTGEVEKRSGK